MHVDGIIIFLFEKIDGGLCLCVWENCEKAVQVCVWKTAESQTIHRYWKMYLYMYIRDSESKTSVQNAWNSRYCHMLWVIDSTMLFYSAHSLYIILFTLFASLWLLLFQSAHISLRLYFCMHCVCVCVRVWECGLFETSMDKFSISSYNNILLSMTQTFVLCGCVQCTCVWVCLHVCMHTMLCLPISFAGWPSLIDPRWVYHSIDIDR